VRFGIQRPLFFMKTIDYDNLSQYGNLELAMLIGLNLQLQHAVIPLSSDSQDERNKQEATYNSILDPLLDEMERRGFKKDDVVAAALHAVTLTPIKKA
jgi:hypothetical protein